MKKRVAICQPAIIRGGRLSVILDIVRYLNGLEITPDLVTSELSFDLKETISAYGKPLHATLRTLALPSRPGGELRTVAFNFGLRRYVDEYDLLINTSNALEGFPRTARVFTYMFFPRKYRLMAAVPDLHLPEEAISTWSQAGLRRKLYQAVYAAAKPSANQQIVCMTEFTRQAMRAEYSALPELPVVYPAVDIEQYAQCVAEQMPIFARADTVVTVGRFSPEKRQLQQIELAQKVPDLHFHIIGFVGNSAYFAECQRRIEELGTANVTLHPNLPFAQMLTYLRQSKYFLHTLINEPFGLTALQAILSGCLPIVHDSGGQRETVIAPQLRYTDLEQVPALLAELQQRPHQLQPLVHKLQDHTRATFSQEVFQERIGHVLAPLLT